MGDQDFTQVTKLLTSEEIKTRLDKFNENYDWSVFNDVPPVQQVEVMYPHYLKRFAFPAREFGIISDQETFNKFKATNDVLEEFYQRAIKWETLIKAQLMIGKKVAKKSGKPFKCQERIITVKGVIDHPYRPGNPALVFAEDDSFCSAEQCKVVK